ncbi:Pr6Pr family membrane protein [Stenotrophomonas pigmentata]|uniref:Pr6Pr family membrane protein n=1 Tax=Stenotrophomonas pigmentata TaxID=3055080 RepID=UPI0026EA2732|nr:Pr6Pr family membrane protein [Stenotrophomonas sp. 610A2]
MTMKPPAPNKVMLAVLAAVAWMALLLQLYLSIELAHANGHGAIHGVFAFLAYFTVLTNLFVALAATLPLAAEMSRPGRFFARPSVLGCATTSIVMVGAGYHLLLRNAWNPQGLQLITDYLLHYVVPLCALAYWIASASRFPLGRSAPLKWCIYPIGYLLYALVRGGLTSMYPYYFIDAASIGYVRVITYAAAMLAAFFVVGLVIRFIAVLRGAPRSTVEH